MQRGLPLEPLRPLAAAVAVVEVAPPGIGMLAGCASNTVDSSRTLLGMSKFWRIVLAWLLAAALPIQGYAAQTMLLCGPANHSSRQVSGSDHVTEEAAVVAGGAPDCHPQAGMEQVSSHCDKASQNHSKHSGKCSVCSSCCSAAAIVSSVVTIAVVHPDLLDVPTVKVIRDRVMVSGLERPPRSPLL